MPQSPSLPDRAALFLDLDGTLIDIAPTPGSVVVPAALPAHLRALRARLSDALAIVTGRPIAQVDALLPDVAYAVAGEHGAAIRAAPDAAVAHADLPDLPPEWLTRAERLVAGQPGALLERKAHSFVVHYRLAPNAGAALHESLVAITSAGKAADIGFALMPAHMAWEVKPLGADKGRAVAMLMGLHPFAGRVPVYVGDDVTDEDGMDVARQYGGLGLRVHEVFGDAAGVRAWLARLAR
jgi:trehalose 6-phosphate phosphatase